jgi:hypothetical protein
MDRSAARPNFPAGVHGDDERGNIPQQITLPLPPGDVAAHPLFPILSFAGDFLLIRAEEGGSRAEVEEGQQVLRVIPRHNISSLSFDGNRFVVYQRTGGAFTFRVTAPLDHLAAVIQQTAKQSWR